MRLPDLRAALADDEAGADLTASERTFA